MKKRYFFLFVISALLVWASLSFLKCSNNDGPVQNITLDELINDTSALVIPLQIDLVSFEPLINEELTKRGSIHADSNVKVGGGYLISYDVRKNGKAQLYPQNNKTRLELPLRIFINLTSGSGAIIPITKELSTDVKLQTDIDAAFLNDWSLQTTSNTTFTILNPPSIRVLGASVSFETQLRKSLEEALPLINNVIEEQIQSILNTQSIAESVWGLIEKPYRFLEEPLEMWSVLQPVSVEQSQLKPSGPGILKNQIILNSRYSILVGGQPTTSIGAKLPNAITAEAKSIEKSKVQLPILIHLDAFSKYLNDSLQVFETAIPGYKENLIVNKFVASANNGQLVVDMNFNLGDTGGKLKLKGQPYYNNQEESLSLKNIQLTSKSNNKVLDKALSTLSKKTNVVDKLANKFSYNLKDTKDALTIDLTKQIKNQQLNEFAKMNGFIESITINDIHCVEDFIILRTELDGMLEVLIGDFKNAM